MPRKPKGVKGTRRQLRQATEMTASAVKHAMQEAAKAIDELSRENIALRRVITGERAEALYYIEKYRALSPSPVPFCDLSEDEQTRFYVEAVKKLSGIEDSPVAEAEPLFDTSKTVNFTLEATWRRPKPN